MKIKTKKIKAQAKLNTQIKLGLLLIYAGSFMCSIKIETIKIKLKRLLRIDTCSFINYLKVVTKKQSHLLMLLLFSPILLNLSGCIGMNSKFDCNAASGGKCAPMSSINKMADYGAFQGAGSRPRTLAQANQSYGYPLNTFAGQPIRSNESIQQIWIGPYEDTNGNYHEPSYLYTVIKKGRWFGEPANVIQD